MAKKKIEATTTSPEKATTSPVEAKTEVKPRTALQVEADAHKGPWVVCKNGNFCELVDSRTKAITGMISLSGVSAPPLEKKDGSVMLAGVGHYRSKPVSIN